MTREINQSVSVSSLPDRDTFCSWEEQGYDRWISVCGVGLRELSDEGHTLTIPGHVYKLADPFSTSAHWAGGDIPSKQVFLAASTPALRNSLLKAVRQATAALRRGEKLMVFCHLGQSRSPLVATAALMLAFGYSPVEAWGRIATQFQVSQLSELGLSALVWLEAEYKLNSGEPNGVL